MRCEGLGVGRGALYQGRNSFVATEQVCVCTARFPQFKKHPISHGHVFQLAHIVEAARYLSCNAVLICTSFSGMKMKAASVLHMFYIFTLFLIRMVFLPKYFQLKMF